MKPSADKDIKKYAETVQKLRENRNLSDDEFALLMGCSGTLRGDETAQCRGCLENRVLSAGYKIVTDMGDVRR